MSRSVVPIPTSARISTSSSASMASASMGRPKMRSKPLRSRSRLRPSAIWNSDDGRLLLRAIDLRRRSTSVVESASGVRSAGVRSTSAVRIRLRRLVERQLVEGALRSGSSAVRGGGGATNRIVTPNTTAKAIAAITLPR